MGEDNSDTFVENEEEMDGWMHSAVLRKLDAKKEERPETTQLPR